MSPALVAAARNIKIAVDKNDFPPVMV